MSIVRAKKNPYGPATLDLQIEQGSDLLHQITVRVGGVLVPMDGTEYEAYMSTEWSPGGSKVTFEVLKISDGIITVGLSKDAQTSFVGLPHPPKKTTSPTPFTLGDWVLRYTRAGLTNTLLGGSVTLLRDPCQS